MNIKHTFYAAAFGLLLGGTVSAAPLTAPEARGVLLDNGFTDISAMDYQDGLWFATARNTDGELVDVRIDPGTREVTWSNNSRTRTTVTTTTTTQPTEPVRVARAETPVVVEEVVEPPVIRAPVVVERRVIVPAGGRINKREVRMVLAANGYHDVHDIDWVRHRGVWKAEARDPTGDDREVFVDPVTGRIVGDRDD